MKKRTGTTFVVLSILLMAFTVWTIYNIFKDDLIYFIAGGERTISVVREFEVNSGTKGTLHIYDSKILSISSGKLSCYDLKGSEIWKKQIPTSDYEYVYLDGGICILDKSNSELHVFDLNGKKKWSYSQDGDVEGIGGRDNYVYAVYNLEGIREVKVFDFGGSILTSIGVSDFEVLNLHKISNHYFITKLRFDGNKSSINLAAVDKSKEKWNINLQSIPVDIFKDGNKIILSTTKEVMMLEEGKKIWSKKYDGSIGNVYVDNSKNKIFVSYKDIKSSISVLNLKGEALLDKGITEVVKKMRYYEGELLLISKNRIWSLNDNLEETLELNTSLKVDDVFRDGKKIIIKSNKTIKIAEVVLKKE